MKVTILKNLWDKSVNYVDVFYVLDKISKPSFKDVVETIRLTDDKNEKKRLKETLPCVLFSGEFSERADDKLIKHSGLICLDFDKFTTDEEMNSYKAVIKNDPYTFAVFESPSGNGIKVVVKTTDDVKKHRQHFKALRQYYNNPNFDSTCINESRVCFMSYDPDIYINKDSKVFTDVFTEETLVIETTENDVINNLYKWWDNRFGFIDGQRNRNVYVLAMAFNEFGVREIDAINFLSQFERPDFTGREIRNCVSSAYKKTHLHSTKTFDEKSINEYEIRHEKKELISFNISDIFTKAYVDVRKPIIKQPVAISMGEYMYRGKAIPRSFGTYGNFSCIVGASKSKKTFLKSMLVASYLGGDTAFYCPLIRGHKDREMFVFDIDTEQGLYDAQRVFKRVMDLCGDEYNEYYKPFALRAYEPKERLEFVEWLIYESDYRDNIGLVSIDGIVDLAYDFNDLKESSSLIQKVMRWTDDKQIHLTTIIHTNPGSSKPSGHLGTSILKKAETICEVEKLNEEESEVKFPFTRGVGISKFSYKINSDGLPYLADPLEKKANPVSLDDDNPF